MGSRKDDRAALDDEKPQHTVTLPALLVSRYPITNAQYRPFVEGGGYDDAHYWTPDGWAWRTGREPDLSPLDDVRDEEFKRRYAEWLAQRTAEKRAHPFWWDHPRWGVANRPVVGVSWYEALAYCRWLTETLQAASSRLHVWRDGQITNLPNPISTIRLPSEAEWEKAARGAAGRRWPWGDEWLEGQANTEEAGIGETSAVGAFPAGASPCGALDMAGNVWEWTMTCWGRTSVLRPDYVYPYNQDDGREAPSGPDARVLRGGSWYGDQRNARCACRFRLVPGDCDRDVGFRVVVSLASSDF